MFKKIWKFLRTVFLITIFHIIPVGGTLVTIVLFACGYFKIVSIVYVSLCSFTLVSLGLSFLIKE